MESVSFWVFNPCGSKKAGNSQAQDFAPPTVYLSSTGTVANVEVDLGGCFKLLYMHWQMFLGVSQNFRTPNDYSKLYISQQKAWFYQICYRNHTLSFFLEGPIVFFFADTPQLIHLNLR